MLKLGTASCCPQTARGGRTLLHTFSSLARRDCHRQARAGHGQAENSTLPSVQRNAAQFEIAPRWAHFLAAWHLQRDKMTLTWGWQSLRVSCHKLGNSDSTASQEGDLSPRQVTGATNLPAFESVTSDATPALPQVTAACPTTEVPGKKETQLSET